MHSGLKRFGALAALAAAVLVQLACLTSIPIPTPSEGAATLLALTTTPGSARPTFTVRPTITRTSTPTNTPVIPGEATVPGTFVPNPTRLAFSTPLAAAGTPIPRPARIIEPGNLSPLVALMQFGGGAVLDIRFAWDGSLLGIETTADRLMYEAGTLETRRYDETAWSSAFGPVPGQLQGVQLSDGVYVEQAQDGSLVSLLEGAVNLPAAFSQDYALAAGFISREQIGVWETSSGALLRTLDTRQALDARHCSDLMDPVFSPDGIYLAAGCRHLGAGYLWRIDDTVLVHVLETETGQLGGLSFSRDARLLAAALPANQVAIWRVRDGALQRILQEANGSSRTAVGQTAFSPDGYYLVAGFTNGELLVWRLSDLALLRVLQGPGFFSALPGEGLEITPDGGRIVYASWNQVLVRSAENGQILQVIRAETDEDDDPNAGTLSSGFVRSLAISPDSRVLAVLFEDARQSMTLYRLADGRQLEQIQLSGEPAILRSAQQAEVLAVGTNLGVYLYDFAGQPLTGGFLPPEGDRDILVNMALSPNGELLALSRSESGLEIWDWRSQQLLAELSPLAAENIQFSPGGSWLAASSAAEIRVYSSDGWDEILQQSGLGQALAFSPPGTLLLASNAVSQVLAVDVEEQQPAMPVLNSPAVINSLAFHPAGRWFAIAYLDGTIRIFGVN